MSEDRVRTSLNVEYPLLFSRSDAVLVQGITGREGSYWSQRMKNYGTNIVAGVSPGKGGRVVADVPVYDSVAEATGRHRLDVAVMFVPPLAVKEAALHAVSHKIRQVVILTEHVPQQDVMEILAGAREQRVAVLGPNTAGLVIPGEVSIGIMPCFASSIFRPGHVGVISRSGSLGALLCLELVRAGFGQSAFLGIGGDPIVGTTMLEATRILERDSRTRVILLVGEIGGSMEEETAEILPELEKPVIALVAGKTAPPDQRMGHAGAVLKQGVGKADAKVIALRRSGATILEIPPQIGHVLRELGFNQGASI